MSKTEQIRFEYLNNKLKLIQQREKEIENSLKAFHPGDTVSETSAIKLHHEMYGHNSYVRDAVEKRMNNLKGLNEQEIQSVLSKEKFMNKIDNEFQKLPPLQHDCIVYKGVAENPIFERYNKPFQIIDNAKVGDIIVPDTAYTYTAFERTMAENWGGPGARSMGLDEKINRIMMYEIHLPKGAKVSRNWEHQGEVLMPRGAQYKIIDKKIGTNGDLEVKLEYILPKS